MLFDLLTSQGDVFPFLCTYSWMGSFVYISSGETCCKFVSLLTVDDSRARTNETNENPEPWNRSHERTALAGRDRSGHPSLASLLQIRGPRARWVRAPEGHGSLGGAAGRGDGGMVGWMDVMVFPFASVIVILACQCRVLRGPGRWLQGWASWWASCGQVGERQLQNRRTQWDEGN